MDESIIDPHEKKIKKILAKGFEAENIKPDYIDELSNIYITEMRREWEEKMKDEIVSHIQGSNSQFIQDYIQEWERLRYPEIKEDIENNITATIRAELDVEFNAKLKSGENKQYAQARSDWEETRRDQLIKQIELEQGDIYRAKWEKEITQWIWTGLFYGVIVTIATSLFANKISSWLESFSVHRDPLLLPILFGVFYIGVLVILFIAFYKRLFSVAFDGTKEEE